MSNNTKPIRTPGGINLGDPIPINGKRGVHMRQGKKTEDLLPETIVECITGRQVARIIFKDDYWLTDKQNEQSQTLSL